MYKVDLENFAVIMPGGRVDKYNEALADSKGITDADKIKILETHIKRYELFDLAESTPVTAKGALRVLAEELALLENELQTLWKFGVNPNYHSYWFRIPHCTCAKMDNAERIGTGMNVITLSCPVHGGSVINGKICPESTD